MPRLPRTQNPVVLFRQFRSKFAANTNITNFDTDSKTRALIEPLAEAIATSQRDLQLVIEANSLESARGQDLDNIGIAMGRPRKEAEYAFARSGARIMAFYTNAANFGAINGGNSIPLTNTQVSTDANENLRGAAINYNVDDVTLDSTLSFQFVSVTADLIGADSRVGQGVLKNHNFTNYTDSANNSLLCINLAPILTGRNRESDDQYRFILSRLSSSHKQFADDRLFMRGVSVAGVSDIRVDHGYYGLGTAAVFVLGTNGQSDAALLAAVQEKLDAEPNITGRVIATAATQVSFDMDLDVYFTRPTTTNARDRISAVIRGVVRDYFISVGLGNTVDFDALGERIRQELSDVVAVGAPGNRSEAFTRIYMRRSESNGTSSEQERLTTSIVSLDTYEYPFLGTLNINYN